MLKNKNFVESVFLHFPITLELSNVHCEGDRLYFTFTIQEVIENDEDAKGYNIEAEKQEVKLFLILTNDLDQLAKQQFIDHFTKYIGKPIEELKQQLGIALQDVLPPGVTEHPNPPWKEDINTKK